MCVLTIFLNTQTAAYFQKGTLFPSLSLQRKPFYFTDGSGTGKHCCKRGKTLIYNLYSSSYCVINFQNISRRQNSGLKLLIILQYFVLHY